MTPNGKAEKAGLVSGDYITAINSTSSDGLKHLQAQQLVVKAIGKLELEWSVREGGRGGRVIVCLTCVNETGQLAELVEGVEPIGICISSSCYALYYVCHLQKLENAKWRNLECRDWLKLRDCSANNLVFPELPQFVDNCMATGCVQIGPESALRRSARL